MSGRLTARQMKQAPLIPLVWLVATCPVPVLAQIKPEPYAGSRIPVSTNEMKQADTRRVFEDFANCVVKKRRALASAYILDRSAFDFQQKYGRLADGECLSPTNALALGIELKLDDESMRYGLAEALLRTEISAIEPTRLSNAPPIPTPVVYDFSQSAKSRDPKLDDAAVEEMRAKALAKIVMYKFGDCTVRTAPVAARALLQALPGREEERIAVDALRPALASCLEKGSQVTLNRTRLRGAIAVSYYSLAHARSSPTP